MALCCGFDIVERHARSRIVADSGAQNERDATVAWNYIALRFRAPHSFLIEAFLTCDEMILSFFSVEKQPAFVPLTHNATHRVLDVQTLDVDAHSCASCAQTACFRHRTRTAKTWGRTAFLLDENWDDGIAFVLFGDIDALRRALRDVLNAGVQQPQT